MLLHLDAVIFDFDGVIANSEPLHFEAFGRTLAEVGPGRGCWRPLPSSRGRPGACGSPF